LWITFYLLFVLILPQFFSREKRRAVGFALFSVHAPYSLLGNPMFSKNQKRFSKTPTLIYAWYGFLQNRFIV